MSVCHSDCMSAVCYSLSGPVSLPSELLFDSADATADLSFLWGDGGKNMLNIKT